MFQLRIDASQLESIARTLPEAIAEAVLADDSIARTGQRAGMAAAPVLTGKLHDKIRINKPRRGRNKIRWTVSPGIKYGKILTAGVPANYTRAPGRDKDTRRMNYLNRVRSIESAGWRITPRDFMSRAQAAMQAAAPAYSQAMLDRAIKNAKAKR